MKQQEKSEATRQLLIDTAYKLFYSNGLHKTSIDTITAKVNLSRGAFYHHFKDKKELILNVIQSKVHNRIYDAMIAPLHQQGDPVLILCDTFSQRLKSFTKKEKELGCPLNKFITELGNSKLYNSALMKTIDEWKKAIEDILNRAKAELKISPDTDVSSTALFMISAYEGIRAIRKIDDNDQKLDGCIESIIRYIKSL
ncbi:TetR/AcrR family transcriptional regulator [Chryseobacterium sp. CT-SW4]|uniref:TetR/AcrR family transcriptional regulator n=1 Tax=Chryseobacterium sp. SW-1 TaxID=3157343 RepID=UPI003B01FBF0